MKSSNKQRGMGVLKKNENLNTIVFKGLFISIVLAVSIFSILVKPALALDPLVVWTESGIDDDVMRFSAYSSGWGSEGTAADMGDTARLQWHVAETSPDGAEQVGLAVGSTSNIVYATLYDGTSWTGKKNLSPLYISASRGFSAAYEQSSGDLLIVQGILGNNQIKYWVWDGATWVVDGTTYTFNTATINNDVVWVELASDPTSNQIALMVVDQDKDVAALIWDGDTNTWDSDNEKKLNSAVIPSSTEKQIDVEYMQSGTNQGQALFAWAEGSTIYSWTWTGSDWEGSANSHAAGTYTIFWVILAADPNSDDILLGYYDSQNDIHTIDWDGSAWGTDRVIETSGFNAYGDSYPFDIIFESASSHENHALVVYSDTTQLRYQHTTDISGAWGGEQTPAAFLSGDDCHWIQLVRDLNGTIYMAGQDDGADNLIGKTWDNTSWTNEGVLDTPLYTLDNYMVFAITAPALQKVALSNHSSGQLSDQFDGSDSQTDLNIFRFSLANDSNSLQTVDEIIFRLSGVTGITDATNDLTSVELFIDGSGTPEASATEVDIDGTATIRFTNASGLFSIAVGQSVDYVLQGDFTNLVKDDTLTISLASSDITLDSGEPVGGDSPTPATHTADDVALLDNHSSGQANNQFVACTAKADANLFKFQLTNNSSTDVTVDEVIFQLSSITGIVNGDLSDLRIYDDTNSQDAATGGTPTIGGASDTITFSDVTNGLFVVPAGETIDYILKGDVINLDKGDSVTISLATTDITLDSDTVGGNTPTDATHTAEAAKIATVNHTNGNYAVSFPHQRRVVRDASGYWYAVWVDKNLSTGYFEIKLAKSINIKGTYWETPVTLFGQGGIIWDNDGTNAWYPTMDIDRTRGILHVVWAQKYTASAGTSSLTYSRCKDLSNWNVATSWYRINGSTNGYDYAFTEDTDEHAYFNVTPIYAHSIAVDSSGNPHVAFIYQSGGYCLPYYIYGTTSWQAPISLADTTTVNHRYPTVEMDSNDVVHYAWSEYYSGNYRRVYHKSARWGVIRFSTCPWRPTTRATCTSSAKTTHRVISAAPITTARHGPSTKRLTRSGGTNRWSGLDWAKAAPAR
jgi:hypothetical protein